MIASTARFGRALLVALIFGAAALVMPAATPNAAERPCVLCPDVMLECPAWCPNCTITARTCQACPTILCP